MNEVTQAEQAAWRAGIDEGREQGRQEMAALLGYVECTPCADNGGAVIRDTGQCLSPVGKTAIKLTRGDERLPWLGAAPAAVAVPDERAAFEYWRNMQPYKGATDRQEKAFIDGFRAALAATPAAAPVVLPEPDAYLFQHEDTGQTMFVEAQQVEWGFEANNPRLQKISGVYTEQQVRALLATGGQAQAVERGEVLVTVSGFTGSGKSAIAGEIEILCRALGLQVEWPDGDSEKNMTHADWTAALEQYKPRVHIVEQNIPFAAMKGMSK